MKAFRALTLLVVRASFRNRTAVFFTLLLPIFFMVIFGVVFGNRDLTLRLGVVDNDRTATSADFVTRLEHSGGITLDRNTEDQERNQLKTGQIVLVVIVPSGFADAIHHQGHATLRLLEGSQTSQTASIAAQVVNQVTAGFVSAGAPPPVSVAQPEVASVNDVRALDYFLPAMIAYIILQAGINFVAITLVDQRSRLVLRRFRATPLTPFQILGAHIVGGGVTVLLQVIVLVAVGLSLFGAHVYGNWLVASVAIAVGTLTFVGIGFLLTSAARTSEAARGLASAVAFPMMFLSGIFIPVDQLPAGLQAAVHVLPLTWLSDALHRVMNDGAGLLDIALDLAVLGAWALVCFGLATWRFRWE